MTDEERRLGLDPSKYTKKPFNPQDSFGFSKGGTSNPLFQVVEDMRPREEDLMSEQAKAMGQMMPNAEMTPVGLAAQKQRMFEAMSQAKDTDFQASDRAFYAAPDKQALIKQLGLDYDNERGVPILQEDDSERIDFPKAGDRRTELLRKLMETE